MNLPTCHSIDLQTFSRAMFRSAKQKTNFRSDYGARKRSFRLPIYKCRRYREPPPTRYRRTSIYLPAYQPTDFLPYQSTELSVYPNYSVLTYQSINVSLYRPSSQLAIRARSPPRYIPPSKDKLPSVSVMVTVRANLLDRGRVRSGLTFDPYACPS